MVREMLHEHAGRVARREIRVLRKVVQEPALQAGDTLGSIAIPKKGRDALEMDRMSCFVCAVNVTDHRRPGALLGACRSYFELRRFRLTMRTL